ncbi:MAG TPA: nitroreductase family protein [Candidatus Dormibacteraeota bacterium]|jgi:nitroreductase|nr:nitroreductase family protein [Candidatus Dormibacteraeota bacterium]
MSNPAPVEFPVNELIQNRWSPRAFSDKLVPQEVLRSLFEAARWAPSSNNEQPWAYIVATKDDAENFEKSLGALVEFNANWAKKAPVLVIAVAELAFAKSNAPNRNAQYDVGAASLQLSIEATARGLVVHQMAGFDPETAKEAYDIPQGWEPIAAMAIGYPGDASSLPEPLQSREKAPRSRKRIREFVMSGQWGHTAEFAK